jgi:hypothetical protein
LKKVGAQDLDAAYIRPEQLCPEKDPHLYFAFAG